jgi:hypothetical protein
MNTINTEIILFDMVQDITFTSNFTQEQLEENEELMLEEVQRFVINNLNLK